MNIQLSKTYQAETTLVCFAINSTAGKEKRLKLTHPILSQRLKASVSDGELSVNKSECLIFRDFNLEINNEKHRHIVLAGLSDKMEAEDLRQLSASILSAVKSLKSKSVAIDFDGLPVTKKNTASLAQALIEGLILSSYEFNELKTKAKKEEAAKSELVINLVTKLATDASLKKSAQEAMIIGETVNFSRRLGDLPGNLMTPTILANEVVAAVKGTGIKATIWDKARIKKEKMGGLLGVSQGSDQEPRFIILEYKGAAASKKPICFVGKGLTFDCGGISIKPSASMEEMKYDMCGGANVIGAAIAIAKLKLKLNFYCLVPATENLVNGSATKPGDIHFARNGKSFEVNNTDAEGRLILADALAYASELKPQMIVDAATLTGAMAMALGNLHTGYFTKDENLKKKIEIAANKSGEWVWNMPLCDHHLKDMKGTYADLSNISSGKGAGSATAAAFLSEFVEEGIPWAHFDIAGTAWSIGGRVPYAPKKGASGVMIRTFVELAKLYS